MFDWSASRKGSARKGAGRLTNALGCESAPSALSTTLCYRFCTCNIWKRESVVLLKTRVPTQLFLWRGLRMALKKSPPWKSATHFGIPRNILKPVCFYKYIQEMLSVGHIIDRLFTLSDHELWYHLRMRTHYLKRTTNFRLRSFQSKLYAKHCSR